MDSYHLSVVVSYCLLSEGLFKENRLQYSIQHHCFLYFTKLVAVFIHYHIILNQTRQHLQVWNQAVLILIILSIYPT